MCRTERNKGHNAFTAKNKRRKRKASSCQNENTALEAKQEKNFYKNHLVELPVLTHRKAREKEKNDDNDIYEKFFALADDNIYVRRKKKE
jgi:hypothetical protein